jgi:putative phage-type endonuclease
MRKVTEEEYLARKNRIITATDAPYIMGVSPWGTRAKRMEHKVCWTEIPVNAAMQRGIDLEPYARQASEARFGKSLPSCRIIAEEGWFGCSPDGLSDDGTLLEIKCPNIRDHELAVAGFVPGYYYPQLQLQMRSCNVREGWYQSHYPGHETENAWVHVQREEVYCQNMLQKCREFYEEMLAKRPEDYEVRQMMQYEQDELYLSGLIDQKKQIDEEVERVREIMIDRCEGKRAEGNLFTFKPTTRKGTIDYKNIPELRDVDLEAYRKPETICWQIERK